MERVHWSARLREERTVEFWEAEEAALACLIEAHGGFVGLYFDETYDPLSLSCPRGLLFQSALDQFEAVALGLAEAPFALRPMAQALARYSLLAATAA